MRVAEKNPNYRITIFEKSPKLLGKVKISGGGRCNVTHACFDARSLTKHYPRGEKQLLGPFNRFSVTDTIAWFNARGVKLKAEEDGRMFPISDSSQTIIDCFLKESSQLGINIKTRTGISDLLQFQDAQKWQLKTDSNELLEADNVIVTTGPSGRIWDILSRSGHTIVPAIPLFFTFNIKSDLIKGLEGLSAPNAIVTLEDSYKLSSTGPILITHWGLSGPAVLKLSAWGARYMASVNHRFNIKVNWTGIGTHDTIEVIRQYKNMNPKKCCRQSPFWHPKTVMGRMPSTKICRISWKMATARRYCTPASRGTAGPPPSSPSAKPA